MSNSARVNLTEPLSYWEKVYLHFRIRAVKLTRNIKHRIGLTERAPIFHFIRDRYLDRSEAAYDDFSLGDWKLEDYGEIPRIFYLTQYSSARGRPDGSLCDRVKVGMWRLERGRVFRLKPPFPNHTALRKKNLVQGSLERRQFPALL